MDIATILGLVVGMITVVTLILLGGSFGMFYDVHALIVIGGGCTAGTLIRFPLSAMAHGFPMGLKYAFKMRQQNPRMLIEEITRVADIYRKGGATALDQVEVEDPFLKQALRFLADGYDADFIRRTLEQDRDTFFQHLDEGQKIYRSIGDAAPAWGMVGTLVGMVQMFSNMEDPSKLGPFMAVALLATLYGALTGNLICLPIADKLHVKLEEEDVSRNLIIDGVLQMRASKSPAVIREMLISYLPDHHKHEMAEAA